MKIDNLLGYEIDLDLEEKQIQFLYDEIIVPFHKKMETFTHELLKFAEDATDKYKKLK